MVKNYFTDKDMQFHFKKNIDWESLVPLYEDLDDKFTVKSAKKMYSQTLKELGNIGSKVLAESAKESDEIGAQLEDGEVIYTPGTQEAIDALVESEGLALNLKREYGGLGMPNMMYMMTLEMLSRGDASFMTIYAFNAGIGKVLEEFGPEDLREKYIPKLASGEFGGSMSLTEPQAGSDLGKIATVAEDKGDYWEITGNKIFISNGNGELSLVLARSNDEPGVKALSMYLVPRHVEEDGTGDLNFKIGGIEHKLGIKSSPTCELVFDKSKGYLVGEEGQGMKQMFQLMNEARLGVSIQSLAIAAKAFDEASQYAKEREQFDKPIGMHELLADKLLDMETDVKAMRSMIYKAFFYEDMKSGLERKLEKFNGSAIEKEKLEVDCAKYKHLAREMVPLVKYFTTEKCIDIARDGVQIHGGNGFTTEYAAEMHLRNSIITTIYEGTSQIQALMSMNDTLKSSKVLPYTGFMKILKSATVKGGKKDVAVADALFSYAVDYLKRPFLKAKIKKSKELKDDAVSYAMLNAERLTRMKAYKNIIDILYDEAEEFPERKEVAQRFAKNYIPEMAKELGFITSGDKTVLEKIKK